MPENLKFLAFDTSTDRMSIALTDGARMWERQGPGGAQASATLIPGVMALLAEAGLALGDLRAVVFGRGPGSFTGLRTACAVAQGLAFGAGQGAGIDVLPVDTLLAVAEEARARLVDTAGVAPGGLHVTALLDARMHEMYVQDFHWDGSAWGQRGDCTLMRPEALVPPVSPQGAAHLPHIFAGNVFGVYAARLPDLSGFACVEAFPTAQALLRLAPALAASGYCVNAAGALPLYVRDKVALTTEERAAAKAQQASLAAREAAAATASGALGASGSIHQS